MRSVFGLGLTLVIACGGSPARPPPEGRPAHQLVELPDPKLTLKDLAAAVKADDGDALDQLIHPELGLWLWSQPGAAVAPAVRLVAGTGTRPSARLPDTADFNAYWRAEYWPSVVGGIERGLAVLDEEPPDRGAGVYGDCGDPDRTDRRAWLAYRDALGYQAELAAGEGVTLDPRLIGPPLQHFHQWGLDVWMLLDRERLWIVHVMVWTPCDA